MNQQIRKAPCALLLVLHPVRPHPDPAPQMRVSPQARPMPRGAPEPQRLILLAHRLHRASRRQVSRLRLTEPKLNLPPRWTPPRQIRRSNQPQIIPRVLRSKCRHHMPHLPPMHIEIHIPHTPQCPPPRGHTASQNFTQGFEHLFWTPPLQLLFCSRQITERDPRRVSG